MTPVARNGAIIVALMDAGPHDFVLPEGAEAAAVLGRLGEHLRLTVGPSSRSERTVLDTFDGRLRAAGLVAELGASDGVMTLTVAGAEETRSAPVERGGDGRILAVELPEGPLREHVAPLLANRALLPVARVRSRLQPAQVLDEEDKTVVRLVVEHAEVVPDEGRPLPLPTRLRLLAVRGYARPLAEVRALVVDDLGLLPAEEDRVAGAVRALGLPPGGVSTEVDVGLSARQPGGEAAGLVLLRLADIVDAQLPGTLADLDPEFLHDLRVAVRRARSVLRELKGVLPDDRRATWRAELTWVQEVTGPTRDLDVHLEDLPGYREWLSPALRPDLAPLEALLVRRRGAALSTMRRHLRSARYRRFTAAYRADLERLAGGTLAGGPDAGRPVAKVAARRIRHVYATMVEEGSTIGEGSPAEALHDLRKRGKELRYLLELFGSLFPAEEVKPMVRSLKALQDVLGRHQDRDVQAAALRSLAPELAGVERGPEALMAMGLLVDRLEREQVAARAEFADRFADFADDERRRAVGKAFR